VEAQSFLAAVWYVFTSQIVETLRADPLAVALKLLPFVLFLELPVYLLVFAGVMRFAYERRTAAPPDLPYYPRVSCVITCYSEGEDVKATIRSLATQYYPGHIEIIPVIDGAIQNDDTLRAAHSMSRFVKGLHNRTLRTLSKPQRGGRVSSLNAGRQIARGEIIMTLDGDTSFDNDMVVKACRHFADPNVVGVAGNLRVRNARASIVTRLQAIEYMLSIHASKVGLDQFNVVNNISGAFGVFRKKFIDTIGGHDSGTAEDLDITLRMKKYFARHPHLRIRFEPEAMGHTDAPETLLAFLGQRLRWDGDLFYLYFRKYRDALRPGLLGWRNFLMVLWPGMLFQVAMPLIVIVYTTYLFFAYPAELVLALLLLVYVMYLFLTCLAYLQYLLLLSERPQQDLELAWCVPLFPLLAFITRAWSAVATLSELFMRSHLDSSMAPWWVLKRTKF